LKQLLYLSLVLIIFGGCSWVHQEQQIQIAPKALPSDLDRFPQEPASYSKNIQKSRLSNQDFFKKYFRVWSIKSPSISKKNAMWPHYVYKHGDSYGENLQLIERQFFDDMLLNSNFDAYASINKKALSLRLLNIRAFPTDKPLLRDPKRAGEGFPFDYMQNSTIAPNKPLFVSHYSRDREWAFVETSFAFGWVKTKDIVFIPNKHAKVWQKAEHIFLTTEGVPIYAENGEFLFKSRIGMLLALIDEDEQSFRVLTISAKRGNKPLFNTSRILKKHGHKGALSFNSKNINKILTELMKTNYGWGGMYEQRDCSSMLRDFYMPFALWLPRNSSMQAQQGEKISLEGLSNEEKIQIIKEHAIPFETLLYKRGHIVLYVGTFDDEVVVFQNVWAVQTKKDGVIGKNVVGKAVFSGLELGKNLDDFDVNGSVLLNLKSMSFPAKIEKQ